MDDELTRTSAPAAAPAWPTRGAPHAADSQFLPGTILSDRYRMIGLLGRGGMGEVYRADDLKLGQPVALKFLPADVERDADRLDRFLNEVRLSLRVTHPNVCRVFDIGQIDPSSGGSSPGRHFLSMEFVDGEDLASLLRRIGRLPEDKAIEIARQLCAGLSAAHDEGVLHRDLKPANVMIDGRGRAKITDFGLAGATGGISGAEARAGTPQYMAPEQVAGRELSERTDLYALGLVLYELFTGKRAFEITSLDDLQRLQSSTPTSPTSHVSGLNPLVERAILRCLDPDPAKRPASAAALAASLPGGDPLAMAIAAGDTPSPEMVAAAGSDTRLRPATAWMLLGAAAIGMLATSFFAQHLILFRVAVPLKPPDVLIDQAREILADAGLRESPEDNAWGLAPNYRYLNYMVEGRATGPHESLASHGALFWYRESRMPIQRLLFLQPDLIPRVSFFDPPIYYSGESRLFLDREGRLRALVAAPPHLAEPAGASDDPDWSTLFRAAGLEPEAWTPAEPQWTPLFHADRRAAWIPTDEASNGPVRVEAASFQGRPVSFEVIFPWTAPDRMLTTRRTPGEQIGNLIGVFLFTALMIGAALVARRNLRLDRGDRRGAIRLGALVVVLLMLVWLIDESHVLSIWELYLFLMGAGWALFVGTLVAVFYLALEPFVRRTWPGMIVSWSRAIAGRLRDPLVARDALAGLAAGGLIYAIEISGFRVATAVTGIAPRMLTDPRVFIGVPHVVSHLMVQAVIAIFFALALLLILFSLRKLLRWEWAGIGAGAALLTIGPTFESGALLAAGNIFLATALLLTLLARVGLISTIVAVFTGLVLYSFPLTLPPAGWTAQVGLVGVAVLMVIALAAAREATATSASLAMD